MLRCGNPFTLILWSLASSWIGFDAEHGRRDVEHHQPWPFRRRARWRCRSRTSCGWRWRRCPWAWCRCRPRRRARRRWRCRAPARRSAPSIGQRALPGFHRAGEHRRGAVLVHLHHRRARIGRDGEADRIPHAGDAAAAPFHAALAVRCRSSRNAAAACSSDSLTTTLCSIWPVGLSEPSSKALSSRISKRIDAERLGDVVHVRLVGEAHLRRAEPAHRPGHGLVGVDDERLRIDVVDVVGAGATGCRPCRASSRSTSSRRRRRGPGGSGGRGSGLPWSRRSCSP